MAKRKSHPGDATGRKREQLEQEHREELERRQQEIGLARAAEVEARENEVVEIGAPPGVRTQTRHPGMAGTEVNEDGVMTVDDTFDVQTNDSQVDGVGAETPFGVPGGVPQDQLVRRQPRVTVTQGLVEELEEVKEVPVRVQSERIEFRVNATLEDVTIGQGNVYTFREGVRYRAPRHVYDHLEEKGYIYH